MFSHRGKHSAATRARTARSSSAMFAVVVLVASVLAVVHAAPASSMAVIHVDIAASGANDGTSWSDAYTDLQDALAAATAGDDIVVAEGTYRPHLSDRTVSFALVDDVDVTGGYATGGAAGPDPDLYRTILSGDLAANDLPGYANNGENSYHVVTADNTITTGLTLTGVTITAGNAFGGSLDQRRGGGVYNVGAQNLVVSSTSIVDSFAFSPGGGMYNQGSSLTISESSIDDNQALRGGGMYNEGSSLTISGSSIDGNIASEGGGMYNEGSSLTISGSSIDGNIGQSSAGGMFNEGSSVTMTGSSISNNAGNGLDARSGSSVSVIESSINGNQYGLVVTESGSSAAVSGSVITGNSAGGVLSRDDASTSIRDSWIVSNTGNGGVFNLGSTVTVVGAVVADNSGADGGGMRNQDVGGTFAATSSIVDSVVSNNVASGSGGGIYNFGATSVEVVGSIVANNSANAGGGIYSESTATQVVNSVVADNTSLALGGGVRSAGSPVPTVVNSIVWGNAPSSFGGGAVNRSFSDIEGGGTSGTNIDADPLFVGPGNYRLQAASPARGLGDVASVPLDVFDADGDAKTTEPLPDLDQRDRNHTTVDMGAYETPVPWDDFGSARVISGASGSSSAASTVAATQEVGEPDTPCGGAAPVAPINSVWFSWTAPNTAQVRFDTIGSGFDTYLQVYTGSDVSSLTEVACNDDIPSASPPTSESAVFFGATAGTTYQVRVDGAFGDLGSVTLNWGPTPVVTPQGFVAAEGDTGSTFPNFVMNLSAPSPIDVTVDWNTIDFPNPMVAASGSDYVAASGTLTFPAGSTTANIPIEILGDTVVEPPLLFGEWGFLQFSNPTFATTGGGLFGLGVYIIVDDDP